MKHARHERRVAAGFYAVSGVAVMIAAWASTSIVLLVAGIAFMPLALWAFNHYPIDRDW